MKEYVQARKFAEAILSVSQETYQIKDELVAIAPLWSEFNDVIPMYLSDSEKEARLNAFEISQTLRLLILELSRNGKMRLLPKITEQYILLHNEQNDTVVAKVTAKRALSNDEKEALEAALKNRHQKEVTLDVQVDEAVIDGLKVEVNYHVTDDTVATKLTRLIQKLSQEMEVV